MIFALALASLSRLGPSIQRFYLTYFVLGLVANGTAQFAYTRTILTWFNKRRGFALAGLTGSGVGSILIPPLTQWVIDHHGWRNAYLMLGGIALLGLPLTALLVRNRSVPQRVDEGQMSGGDLSDRHCARAPFWILAIIIMLSAFGENGLVTNLAAMLTEHGVTVQAAALALSVRGGAGIIGRLCTGFLIDRFPAQRIRPLSFCSLPPALSSLPSRVPRLWLLWGRLCLASDSEAKRTSHRTCLPATSGASISPCSMALHGPLMRLEVQPAPWWWDISTTARVPIAALVVGLACTTLLAAGLSLFLRRDRTPYRTSDNNLGSASISLEE